ncbi:MAG: hypothetical protein ACREC0_07390 [Methylocella sp.]
MVESEQHSANWSLSAIEPVCGTSKWKLENGEQRPAPGTDPARTEMPKIAGQRLGSLGRPTLVAVARETGL